MSDNTNDPETHTALEDGIMLAHKLGWTGEWRRRDRTGLPDFGAIFRAFHAHGADTGVWEPYLDDLPSGVSQAAIERIFVGAYAAGCFDARMTPWHLLNTLPHDLAGEVLACLDGRPRRDPARDFAAAVRAEIAPGGKAHRFQTSAQLERGALGTGLARDLTDADLERLWEAAGRTTTGTGRCASVIEFALTAIRERVARVLGADGEGDA